MIKTYEEWKNRKPPVFSYDNLQEDPELANDKNEDDIGNDFHHLLFPLHKGINYLMHRHYDPHQR